MTSVLLPLRLAAGQVDIWLTRVCDICHSREPDALDVLSTEERIKSRRYSSEVARIQYLISRLLVRTVLSKYARVPEHVWQFEANAYGRPYIVGPQVVHDLRFNLSNTVGLVACAVTIGCDVGIDVQHTEWQIDIDMLLPTVFAAPELADVCSFPQSDRRDRFFSYWTLKEAYVKARGEGMSIPLDTFWFDFNGGAPLLRVADHCHDNPERWQFRQYAPTAQHKLALAVAVPRGQELSTHLRWTTLLSEDATCCKFAAGTFENYR